MKINSENLYDYINELATNEIATNEIVRFKVYHNDDYVTEVYWDGENFNWESGTFTSGAFFDPFYDFVPIEVDNKIEKINYDEDTTFEWSFGEVYDKINELIDEVNKLKEKK